MSCPRTLDQVRELGTRGGIHPGLVEQTLDGLQAALYRHITAPARWGSWVALQGATQEAADAVADIVAGIADEMIEIRDECELTTHDEDAADTVGSMNRVVDYMRMMVAAVRAAGAPAGADPFRRCTEGQHLLRARNHVALR